MINTMEQIIKNQFYCNQKFWWLTIDIGKASAQSCCSAASHNLDVEWLSQNPGQLFNSPEFVKDRQSMLANQPVKSCESSCWIPEMKNLPSRRKLMDGDRLTHTDLDCSPTTINIVLGTQCNMDCVYCCKNYSSSWRNDILKKGTYDGLLNYGGDRYQANQIDIILNNLSIKEISSQSKRQVIIGSLLHPNHIKNLKTVTITGGEPFLYDELVDIVNQLPGDCEIQVYSGLGVNPTRFSRILDSIRSREVVIAISAESVGEHYEFARHGNTWSRFLENFALVQKSNLKFKFNATLSNITVFNLPKFQEFAGSAPITYQICNDPDFLAINVVDQQSKIWLQNILGQLPDIPQQMIHDSLKVDPQSNQVSNFRKFILEFSKRRNLSLDIFPETFVSWINS
jgi:organic radical activating enzyme